MPEQHGRRTMITAAGNAVPGRHSLEMKMKRLSLAFATIALLLSACAEMPIPTDILGAAVPPDAASRTITIGPQTRYVNVAYGDTVRFVVDGHAFGYKFDGAWEVTSFDLRQVAPAGLLDHRVEAYIAPDDLNDDA
jgi:hypothetical protein